MRTLGENESLITVCEVSRARNTATRMLYDERLKFVVEGLPEKRTKITRVPYDTLRL